MRGAHPFIKIFIGCFVGWFAKTVEYELTGTAWGGIFTILMCPVVAVFWSLKCVIAALLAGLFLRLPIIRNAWVRAGYFPLLLAVAGLMGLIYSNDLGYREIEPISGYSLMAEWPSFFCYFFLVFPFVNLPGEPKLESSPPPLVRTVHQR